RGGPPGRMGTGSPRPGSPPGAHGSLPLWPSGKPILHDVRMSVRRGVPLVAFGAAVVVLVAAWVSWFAGGHTLGDTADTYLLTNSAQALTFTAFGTLVLAWRPRHRIGLLFAAYGWFYLASVACLGLLSGVFALTPAWERLITVVGITVWLPAPLV